MEVPGTSSLRAGTLLWLTLMWAGPAFAADYEVTFEAFWNAADHPTGFPPNAHYSSLWFVGVHDLDLRDGIGFVESLVVDLIPYDAGTEEGTGFSFNNPPSPPGGVIAPADQAAIFGGTSPIA